MRTARLLAVVTGALALSATAAAAAGQARLAQAGGATFPDRSYVLTLPSARSLTTKQVRVTENGVRVRRLSLVGAGARYLVDYRSIENPGTTVSVKVTVPGIAGAISTRYRVPALRLTPAPVYKPSLVGRIVQSTVTMALVAILAVAVLGWGIAVIVRQRAGTLLKRVGSFVQVSQTQTRGLSDIATQRFADPVERTKEGLSQSRLWQKLEATIEISGIRASAGQIVLGTAVGTVVVSFVLGRIIGVFGFLLGLVLTPLLARSLVRAKLARKRRRFAEQLPDCLEVLASALRAGHTLVGALTVVIENASEPSKGEFQRVIAEEQLGVQLEDALQVVVVRMQSRDLDQVALVARLQRETGSNSAEVLDRVVETVRARVELRRQVLTLTAQGRLSRWILTSIPVILALALSVLHPGYMQPLFDHGFGRFLLVAAALMVVAGSQIIKKLVDIKV